MSQVQDKSRIVNAADLVRRGATLLQEACPRDGAVQIRYKGKVYCTKEDNLDSILNPTEPQEASPTSGVSDNSKKDNSVLATPQLSQSTDSLRKLLEEKLGNVSKQLDTTTDLEEQTRLLDLISKYIETLERLKKSAS
ncbi:MAG: hypothetical protein OK439_07545 [Thaumarchaeota archaeon]|nr:hypothetical protein [Nitrososphaerota archaeon]